MAERIDNQQAVMTIMMDITQDQFRPDCYLQDCIARDLAVRLLCEPIREFS